MSGMTKFFFSSRRRHTRCADVTGVQTCALPIWPGLARMSPSTSGDRRIHTDTREWIALAAIDLLMKTSSLQSVRGVRHPKQLAGVSLISSYVCRIAHAAAVLFIIRRASVQFSQDGGEAAQLRPSKHAHGEVGHLDYYRLEPHRMPADCSRRTLVR